MSAFADDGLLWLVELTSPEVFSNELMKSIHNFNLQVLHHALKGLKILQRNLADPTSTASISEIGAPWTLSDDYFDAHPPLISALQRVKSVKKAFDFKPECTKDVSIANLADDCGFPDISSMSRQGPGGKASLRHKQIKQLVTAMENAVEILKGDAVVRALPKTP